MNYKISFFTSFFSINYLVITGSFSWVIGNPQSRFGGIYIYIEDAVTRKTTNKNQEKVQNNFVRF